MTDETKPMPPPDCWSANGEEYSDDLWQVIDDLWLDVICEEGPWPEVIAIHAGCKKPIGDIFDGLMDWQDAMYWTVYDLLGEDVARDVVNVNPACKKRIDDRIAAAMRDELGLSLRGAYIVTHDRQEYYRITADPNGDMQDYEQVEVQTND